MRKNERYEDSVTCTSNLHSMSWYLDNLNPISSNASETSSFLMLYNLLNIASLSSVKPKATMESRKSSVLNYKTQNFQIFQVFSINILLSCITLVNLTLYLQLSNKRLTKPSTEFLITSSSTFNFSETRTR